MGDGVLLRGIYNDVVRAAAGEYWCAIMYRNTLITTSDVLSVGRASLRGRQSRVRVLGPRAVSIGGQSLRRMVAEAGSL